MATSGVLLWREHRHAASLYAALLMGTIAWAIWEVGFDFWALIPRIAVLAVLGLGYLIPSIRYLAGRPSAGWRNLSVYLSGMVAATLVGAVLHSLGTEIPDPLYQAGSTAPEKTAAKKQMVAAIDETGRAGSVDWLHYGNDQGGSRFSPLQQINRDNVKQLKVAWEYRLGPDAKGRYGAVEVTPIKVGMWSICARPTVTLLHWMPKRGRRSGASARRRISTAHRMVCAAA